VERLSAFLARLVVQTRPRQPPYRTLAPDTDRRMVNLDHLPLRVKRSVQLFFHPVSRDFALADLLVECRLQCLLLLLPTPAATR